MTDAKLLINACEHLDRALRGVLRHLEPDDRSALLYLRADRIPLWNRARSRDVFSHMRAAGLLKLNQFALTPAGALVAEALARGSEVAA